MSVTYSAEPYVRWDSVKICWVMTRSFEVTWTNGAYLSGGEVLARFTVRRGFQHDGPSIPRRLQGIVSKFGNHFQPAIVHDWTYSNKTGLTRKQADQLFLEGMTEKGVPWYRRRIMYLAVRLGGKGQWG